MKKNAYFRTVIRRRNALKEALFNFCLAFCSWPRLLIEVFIRRNFGERYFSFATAMTLLAVLAVLPLFSLSILELISRYYYRSTSSSSNFLVFIIYFSSWYLYLAAFLVACLKRRKEVKRLPSVFDFARYSLSSGTIHPGFYGVKIGGEFADVHTIETLLEPGFALAIGLGLWLFGQPICFVLFLASICYSLSYQAAYHQGDNFVMDKIDEHIINQEHFKTFVEGLNSDQTRGYRFYGRRPADPDARREVADMFYDEEEETVEAL